MQQLLGHVDQGRYDGVLVMDIDRLGRGDHADWAEICKTFLYTDTYVITPQKTYDLSQEQDEMLFDFQAIFAKMEYKMIKKRMRQGKVAGAKKGMWTNGRPPYPYEYNQAAKTIEVNANKLKIYRAILDKYLLGMSTLEISYWLNRNNIAPPYNGKRNKYGWSHVTVHRLLLSEIHLGYIVYGKSRNNRGVAQLVDREEWIKVRGEHEAVKTEEEHAQIMARVEQNRIIPRKNRAGTLPLSGLLYCSKCGCRMQFKRRETKNGTYWTVLCTYAYSDGRKCEQVGRKLDEDFYGALYQQIIKLDEQSLELIDETNEQCKEVKAILEVKQKELIQTEKSIEKLFELFEDGCITKQRLAERIAGHEKAKVELETEMKNCKTILANQVNLVTVEMIQKRINEFKQLWTSAIDPSEQNRAFRLLVDRIEYNREEDGVRLEVLYK